MPPPERAWAWARRKVRMSGVLFVDLRDQLAVWLASQFIRVELEVVRLRTVIGEVWIAIQKLLDVSGDECAHDGNTGMTCDRRLPNRERPGHLLNLKIKKLTLVMDSTHLCCARRWTRFVMSLCFCWMSHSPFLSYDSNRGCSWGPEQE